MIKMIVFLAIGFVLLIRGADFFVEGSSSLALKLHVSPLIIGLTVVAMGTSLPELSVSVVAALNNSNSLAISNVLGSNIFNFLVVLGISAMLNRLEVKDEVLKRDFPVSIGSSLLLVLFGYISQSLTRISGVIFLIIFVVYMIIIVKDAVKGDYINKEEKNDKIISLPKSLLFIVVGIVAIKFGGDITVDSAVDIAEHIGISETIIGLTIVSVGTSLPELVTSIVAAKKGKHEMAIGNVVGSNIFNILLILGVASTISPIEVINHNIVDAGFLIIVSIMGLIFCITKKYINRIEGAVMTGIYVVYMIYILYR